MIFETFDKPGFGEQDISGDRDQPADGECRTDGGRCGAGVSIDEQDRCIDDIADTDHSLNLPALSRAARQRLGREFATDTLRRIRRRIQKRRRRDTHKFAMVKAIGEMYEAKPLGLVSFGPKSRDVKRLFALVCAKKSAV